VERAYGWVHAAARVLNNHQDESAAVVRRRFDGLVGAMVRHRGKAGALADAIERFRKVARSYRPGLFHCYAVPGLPRDPQRPRAMVRRATPSRPTRDRAQDGLARHRAARRGAADHGGRNADQTANSGRPGPGPGLFNAARQRAF
jgi:hypothetical protein